MPKKIAKGFTILELLVVLVVLGVFSAVAYPNISNWITDRNVKKEVYETVAFIKERKAEVTSGKYGMTQIVLNRQLLVFTMSPEKFFEIYKGFNSPYPTHKKNYTCGFSDTAGFTNQVKFESEDFGVYVPDSNVHIYPSAWHSPFQTVLCITKDGTIKFTKYPNKTEKDPSTDQNVDIFVFCSKSNSTQQTCKLNTNLDYRYKITLDNFQNIKIYKYNKKKNSWISIDG